MRAVIAAAALAVAACNTSTPLQPHHQNDVDSAPGQAPVSSQTGSLQAEVNGSVGNIDVANQPQARQEKPEQVVAKFGDLLHRRDFKAAYALWGPNPGIQEKTFEKQFAAYRTIDAALGKVGPTEGAAGSLYSTVQLTLSGTRKDGGPYAISGPVTLRRVSDVPGSTAGQRRWHIEKMELTADARTHNSMAQQ